jgi:hypothetical protein
MKLALCFLTYDTLSQPALWHRLIEANKDIINVYIHNKTVIHNDKYDLKKYCIPRRVKTKWGHISLVYATMCLFEEAFKNKDNEYFLLLSDTCIPLHNIRTIYNDIVSIGQSILCSVDVINVNRFLTLRNKHFFKQSDFSKQMQWMCLKRNDVAFFLQNDFTSIFGPRFLIPDEHYFITIMKKYKIPFHNKCITFANWRQKSDNMVQYRPFPKTYSSLSNKQIYIILRENTYFMRKVAKETVLPLYFDSLS